MAVAGPLGERREGCRLEINGDRHDEDADSHTSGHCGSSPVGCLGITAVSAGHTTYSGSFSGDNTCVGDSGPGLSLNQSNGAIILYCGGITTYTLSYSASGTNPVVLSSMTITANPTAGVTVPSCSYSIGNTSNGGCTTSTGYLFDGIFGRWQCLMPTYNACIYIPSNLDQPYLVRMS